MSRWTTPIWWACSSASAAWMPRFAARRKNSRVRCEPSVETGDWASGPVPAVAEVGCGEPSSWCGSRALAGLRRPLDRETFGHRPVGPEPATSLCGLRPHHSRDRRSPYARPGDLRSSTGWGPETRANRCRGLAPRRIPQLADYLRQRLPLDVLHRVVMDAPLATDGVDADDVRVFQGRRRPGLVLKRVNCRSSSTDAKGRTFNATRRPSEICSAS